MERVSRVLNPMERLMDEAIFNAFRTGSTEMIRSAVGQNGDIFYRRHHSDGTTALMSAAWCADVELTHLLLNRGVRPDLVDANGFDAADLAVLRGRQYCQHQHQQQQEQEQQQGGGGGMVPEPESQQLHVKWEEVFHVIRRACEDLEKEEYVYDLYCLDPSRSRSTDTTERASSAGGAFSGGPSSKPAPSASAAASSSSLSSSATTTSSTGRHPAPPPPALVTLACPLDASAAYMTGEHALNFEDMGEFELASLSDGENGGAESDEDPNDEAHPWNDYPDSVGSTDDEAGGRLFYNRRPDGGDEISTGDEASSVE
eukprot:CAMPEP_0185747930 /NCGR_PEP_ID=MMETSP1174-20130828/6579_1 /TAXON_ID=35687 /ORGANISM="Dictyocha speculum, Strain CCMP1381" /LENGTH=314 /DNA_ID=CAMNT_0028423359 /DNA_START=84 /DNA_END=1025 /DNA_ORIENTATION=-